MAAYALGQQGVLETSLTAKEISLHMEGEKTGRTVPIGAPNPGGYLEAFLSEMRGESHAGLTQAEIFRASRVSLKAPETADRNLLNVQL